MTQQNKSERTQTSLQQSQNLKITRDPVTGYPMVNLFNTSIVLQKDVKAEDVLEKPLVQIKECVL